MRDWKKKLTSRKFWAAVIGVVLSVCVMFGVESDKQDKIAALITSSATLIAYIVGEGLVDATNKNDKSL